MIRLGILGSTRGTHLQAIYDAIAQKQLAASINIVVSNKADAYILERAKSLNLPHQLLESKNIAREVHDQQLSTIFLQHNVDVIVLIGYMRILSQEFVITWNNKIINVHPSLLPAFAGKMDLDVHSAVLAEGVKETGCTVHYVTQEVDAGPIILQLKCPVLNDDTPDRLKQRVQELEGKALVMALQAEKMERLQVP